MAVTHIQNTAPAPPAETAATTPTRLPMPTRVAVEMISVWKEERPSLPCFFSHTAAIISRNSRTGKRRVRQVNQMPAVNSSTTMKEMPMPPPSGMVNRSPHKRR